MTLSYSDFQAQSSSEKIGLCKVEVSERLMGWVLHSGSIYKYSSFPSIEIISVVEGDSDTSFTTAASIAGVTAGKYFLDPDTRIIYVRATDSSHPNGKFMAVTYSLFFSNVSITAPYDLSTGKEVLWLPYLDSSSDFGVQLDNKQLGVAIDGNGNVKFLNDHSYWDSRFDALYFENQRVRVYSWNRNLPITEAKLIYRGRVESKAWSPTNVTLNLKDILNELNALPEISNLSDIVGARVPDALLMAKKRLVYGRVFGHRLVSIDQILDGYPITGTATFTNGSKIVTGSGTSFLTQLSPDDTILVSGSEEHYTIDSVDTATQVTLSKAFEELTVAGASVLVRPNLPIRYANRVFSICGNQIREPSTTVTRGVSLNRFEVASIQDLRVGDEIRVGSEVTTIDQISGVLIKTSNTLLNIPAVSTVVTKSGVENVTLDGIELVYSRDYTYSTSTGLLTLDPLAEYNVADIQAMIGTVTFTSSSRAVTGSGTIFTTQLKVGDWIRAEGQATFYEILRITSDTALTLRSTSGYSATTTAQRKVVNIFNEDESALTCDLLGKTSTGLPGGDLLENAPSIVEDLLEVAGLTDLIDTSSFSDAKDLSSHAIGIVIPENFSDIRPKSFKEYIKLINQSVFGSLYQTNSFLLGYSLLDPDRPESSLLLQESDVIKFAVTSDGKDLVSLISLEYLFREYDHESKGKLNALADFQSLEGEFLAKSDKTKVIETRLVDESSSIIFATRWAMLLERARSIAKIDTKMQASQVNITDSIRLSHEKLYYRVGQTAQQKMGLVSLAKKDLNSSSIEFDDLGNAFSRCSAITENDALDYDDAGETEQILNGYITDQYGLIDNDPNTTYLHKIW